MSTPFRLMNKVSPGITPYAPHLWLAVLSLTFWEILKMTPTRAVPHKQRERRSPKV
ncbi:hypothetical protein JAAARDRAFT_37614 [Jaapia argillacea MUCL 33604]|uniref:Uncharacterized protein n=1 Tax=Jaapia argillacea MUCL 33604 TaxID=933084 RepID=A0A067PXL4_9AGAM|nr:hypothetical protein JAAARDRAFT_37614 [Jaapia argillacea MUCL 33604]